MGRAKVGGNESVWEQCKRGKNEELEVGGGGEIHGRWGGRCDDDGVRCMIIYLSYNICVSAYVVCL